jgi:hypothetical protein
MWIERGAIDFRKSSLLSPRCLPANFQLKDIDTSGKRVCRLFRFYGPEQALFDKTWKLPDIEQTAAGQAEKAA